MNAARPIDLNALSVLVRAHKDRLCFVAGGTDLIIAHNGSAWPELTVDISRTAGLTDIADDTEGMLIGAAVTMATLTNHPGILRAAPMLAQAATQVGSVQIRNRATLGGNIASAMPAADLLPVLQCLGAQIDIFRSSGQHERLLLNQVVLGRGQTCLGKGDLITTIHVPRVPSNHASAFVKLGPREVLSIATLNLAALADYDRDRNHLNSLRVVAGALGPTPRHLHAVETVAQDRPVDQSFADDFIATLVSAVDSAIPGRASHPYKRRAIAGVGLDLLADLFGVEFDVPTLMEQQV